MDKRGLFLLVIILLFLHTYQVINRSSENRPPLENIPVVKPILKQYVLDEILSFITEKDVEKYVEYLSSKDLKGRGIGTDGNEMAAQYICNHLDSLSIPYTRQFFVVRGVKTSNIIAHITPLNSNNDNIIVIGAHFDHLGSKGSSYYPGADDNASGTAGLMAIATALNKYKNQLKHTISLQFYSAEEVGMVGSTFYTNNPLLPKNNVDIHKHIAMINLDMIGYLKDSYALKENVADYRGYKQSQIYSYNLNLKNIVDNLSNKYLFANNIISYRSGSSDHAAFFKKGIPIVFLHTGLHSNYHQTSDTSDKLNYKGLVSISKLALEILLFIDKQ